MATFVVRSPDGIAALGARLALREKWPVTVTVTQGAPRREKQNRLAQQWFTDIARQLEDRDREEIRAECKLRFGVPILRAENEAFRQSYDRVMKHLPYEDKLAAIQAFDMPVTRMMTVKQMVDFMDAMQRHWLPLGIHLTDPAELKYADEFG